MVITNQHVVTFENAGASGPGEFEPGRPLRVARDLDSLTAVASGDLNGDGTSDLAIGEYNSGVLYVLFGNGQGGFSAATEHASVPRPTAIAITDTNGDATSDVIVHGESLVAVHRGTGMGILAAPLFYKAGAGSIAPVTSLALADFDRDGYVPDLATVDTSNGAIAVLRARSGGYPNTEFYDLGGWIAGIVAGDYDQDGDDDLLVSDTEAGLVRWLANSPGGTFVESGSFPVGQGVTSLALVELDVFEGPEIAALHSLDNRLVIFPGYRSPNPVPHELETSVPPSILTTGDFDGDALADLAFASGGPYGGLTVLLTRCTSK